MAPFFALKSAPLALFAALASAPFTMGASESASGGLDDSVWGIPGPIFRGLVSQPNATGSISFSSGNIGQYSLQLNITANVRLTNATESIVENDKGDYSTTSILSLVADSEAPSPNMSICYSVWSGLAANISAAAKGRPSQDGSSCSDMLSEQCVSDLMDASTQFGHDCGSTSSAIDLPQSCIGQMASSYTAVTGTLEYNSSDTVFYKEGADPTGDRGNQTAWSAASTNIWPVLLAFVNGTEGMYSIELNCIRPDTFSQGSTNPNADSTTGNPTGGTSTGASPAATGSPSSGAITAYQASMTMSLGLAMALGLFCLL